MKVIGIHGAPRSGTSWLGQLLNSHERVAYRYQPMFSYAFTGRLRRSSTSADIDRFFNDLMKTDDDFVLQRGEKSLSTDELHFDKRAPIALVYKEVRYHYLLADLLDRAPYLKAIGIVRHPAAVLYSWLNAPREFDESWDLQREWRDAPSKNVGLPENYYGYTRWKRLASAFLTLREQYRGRFLIVSYGRLVQSPDTALREIFEFSDLDMTDQVWRFLHQSTSGGNGDPYGVLRGRAHKSSWQKNLDPAIIESIREDLRGGTLEQFLEYDN